MSRKWTDIRSVELVIMQMRKEGRTRQEIADTLGLRARADQELGKPI